MRELDQVSSFRRLADIVTDSSAFAEVNFLTGSSEYLPLESAGNVDALTAELARPQRIARNAMATPAQYTQSKDQDVVRQVATWSTELGQRMDGRLKHMLYRLGRMELFPQ